MFMENEKTSTHAITVSSEMDSEFGHILFNELRKICDTTLYRLTDTRVGCIHYVFDTVKPMYTDDIELMLNSAITGVVSSVEMLLNKLLSE